MFTDIGMFCPKFATSKQAQMTWYLSMLKTDIRQFVSTQRYGTIVELQEAVSRRKIKMELQVRKRRQALVQTQPVAKQFKLDYVRTRGQRGHTCGKCGRVHEGIFRSSFSFNKCGKEGITQRTFVIRLQYRAPRFVITMTKWAM